MNGGYDPNWLSFGANTQQGLISPAVAAAQNGDGVASSILPDFSGLGATLDKWNTSEGFFGKDSMLGSIDQNGIKSNGWLSTGFGVAKDLATSWMAMQQLDLAKDQFNFQKDAWTKQFDTQASLTNTRLEDRQRARLGANPTGYQSVGDYMKENGV